MQETTTSFEVDAEGLSAVRLPRGGIVAEVPVGPDHYGLGSGPFEHYQRTIEVEDLGSGRHRVTETTRWELAIPLWGRLFRPLVRGILARHSAPPPPPGPGDPAPKIPWWSPPTLFDARSAQVLSRLCGLALLTGYLGTIITQTITFAADEFGAPTSSQGNTLAAVRGGVLLSLGLMVLADRGGRQKLLVYSAIGGAVAAASGALAPNLLFLGGSQTLSRACSTAMALLIAVIAAEEMPAGGRAYAASVLAMTGGLGAGFAVMLVPIADVATPAWRVIYVMPLLALPFFLRVGRGLPESRRFVRPHRRSISLAGHWARLGLLASTAFFGLMFYAPNSQFQNDFLRNEHGFSALQLTIYTLSTGTPAGIGVLVGGRLADIHGRRLVGTVGTIGGAILLTLAYQANGPWLWGFSVSGSIAAALTVPALAVYGPELFPTALRGKANGLISLAGVAGSAVGLVLGGRLEEHFGRFGPGLAILAVGPLVVAVLVLAFYPETAHRELEDINPEDASAASLAPPLL